MQKPHDGHDVMGLTRENLVYLDFLTRLGFCWIITVPEELPYSYSLSAAMTYRVSLEGNFHTAFPILWNGTLAWDPMEELAREAAAGQQR